MNEGMEKKTKKASQSLVNEGRFPLWEELLKKLGVKSEGRNPSLMRAGFHSWRNEIRTWTLLMVAIPR